MTAFLQWWADHWPLLVILPFFVRFEVSRHQEADWTSLRVNIGFLMWDWSWKSERERRREP